MSRCFPFPPPGYAPKLRIDDVNLLAKEKHKEKKEKKHTKDKYKEKEGKERKDRERNKEKHRDRKEKKEKHKDKKRDKNHQKGRISDERQVEGQSECSNVENTLHANQFGETTVVQELCRRIRDVGCATESQSFGNSLHMDHNGSEFSGKVVINNVRSWTGGKEISKDKNRDKNMGNIWRYNEAKVPKVAIAHNFVGMEQRAADMFRPMEKDIKKPVEEKEKTRHNGIDKNHNEDEKSFQGLSGCSNVERSSSISQPDQLKMINSIQELGWTVGVENGLGRSRITEKITSLNWKRAEAVGQVTERDASYWSAGRGLPASGGGCDIKVNGHRGAAEVRGPKASIRQNFEGIERNRMEMVRPMEKDIKRQMEGKQRCKTDGERKSDAERDNSENRHEGRKVENAKEFGALNKELPRSGKVGKDYVDACRPYPFKESSSAPVGDGNTIKRNEPETKGLLCDNDIRPTKLPKLVSLDNTVIENGRKLEVSSTITKSGPKERGMSICHKLEKEHKINGVIEAQQIVTPMMLLPATIKAEQTPEPSPKLPHPDCKYLSCILLVPKMEEWSDFDDQEWLFGGNSLLSGKTEADCPQAGLEQQVWAKAFYIESANVSALPYVLPY
ncbi:hypothetical protein Ancab_019928 [Ancistrocladus abbreviatus]